MAVTDVIIRRGGKDKWVLEGPANLHGPHSDKHKTVGADVHRITGDVDVYEVNCDPCALTPATTPGTYAFTIEPFMQKGIRQPIKAIKWVCLAKYRDDGTAEPLFRQMVSASDRKFVLKPVTTTANERLFLIIQRMGGVSSIQYKLSLDSTITRSSSKTSPQKAEPKPMVEKTEADKAWDLVQSGADQD